MFGSVAYANIPKKLRGGKLEVTSVKCRLLGWWTDETKGYRLEEVGTGKIITARDVTFVEDDTPGDLAIIETRGSQPTKEDIEVLAPEVDEVAENGEEAPAGSAEPTQAEQVVENPENTDPPRDHPRRTTRAPAPPGEAATEEEIDVA